MNPAQIEASLKNVEAHITKIRALLLQLDKDKATARILAADGQAEAFVVLPGGRNVQLTQIRPGSPMPATKNKDILDAVKAEHAEHIKRVESSIEGAARAMVEQAKAAWRNA